jgi:hypothetical protein
MTAQRASEPCSAANRTHRVPWSFQKRSLRPIGKWEGQARRGPTPDRIVPMAFVSRRNFTQHPCEHHADTELRFEFADGLRCRL